MTEKTDETARNVARNAIRDLIDNAEYGFTDGPHDPAGSVADVMANAHTATWERDVNARGVAVRRYALRGAWEVDPERVAPSPKTCRECGGYSSNDAALAVHLAGHAQP